MQAIPQSLFSWSFEIRDGAARLCKIDQSFFRERGTINLNGKTYTLGRSAGWGNHWLREGGDGGPVLAEGSKVSLFGRKFRLKVGGDDYELASASIFSSNFVLRRGGKTVGRIRREGIFTRRMNADLPDTLPVAVRVFIIWLVLMMLRRRQNNS